MSTITTYPFGRTGHVSSRAIFGAAALGGVTQLEADRALEQLLQYGVNHIDTAASYGAAEERIAPWMPAHRGDFFLATKTGQRSKGAARDEIHRSLERLKVDYVDLLQLHNLVADSEWNEAMGPGGALEAAIEARDAGLVRFIGVTGHGLTVARQHLRSLERFHFDSVLLPWNFPLQQNEGYEAEFQALLSLCRLRGVAVQTIKGVTRRPWGDASRNRATWYQPFEDQASLDLAVHWVLGQAELFLNTAGDVGLLPMVLDAASRAGRMPSDEEMEKLVADQEASPLFLN